MFRGVFEEVSGHMSSSKEILMSFMNLHMSKIENFDKKSTIF